MSQGDVTACPRDAAAPRRYETADMNELTPPSAADAKVTPMMAQYLALKASYPY
mgnify:CR=1 FL=1